MLAHRITWVADNWARQRRVEPYHPLFVPTNLQGRGRFDNPDRSGALYVAHTPQGAVGEVFGDFDFWTKASIERTRSGHPRCLVTYAIDDAATLLDLDDAAALMALALRPTDVVRRNRDRTLEVALQLWLDRKRNGLAGLTWWSYWRPEWKVSMLWSDNVDNTFGAAEVAQVEPLAIDHDAVTLAADVLHRTIAPQPLPKRS